MLILNRRNMPGKLLFVEIAVKECVPDQLHQVQCENLVSLLTKDSPASSRQCNRKSHLNGLISIDDCAGSWKNLLTWRVDVKGTALWRAPTTVGTANVLVKMLIANDRGRCSRHEVAERHSTNLRLQVFRWEFGLRQGHYRPHTGRSSVRITLNVVDRKRERRTSMVVPSK
jgi:hypothetical protein